jgi:deazaflavin-dependent oxidoreductase (nitroreductase family)
LSLRDTGLPVIIVTNRGWRTGAIRKTPPIQVIDGTNYVLVASKGGAPTDPDWVRNLRSNSVVEIRDKTQLHTFRVREVVDEFEKGRLWGLAVAAYLPYRDYQEKNRERNSSLFSREDRIAFGQASRTLHNLLQRVLPVSCKPAKTMLHCPREEGLDLGVRPSN